uniref:Uncharacterized protein n=1 Tax=Avena sativa TaxID=4498 RepID=A0ACD5UJM0_AVESA
MSTTAYPIYPTLHCTGLLAASRHSHGQFYRLLSCRPPAMAALFVLVLVLAVSGGAAGDTEPRLPRLKFRDATSMNGCGSFVGFLNVTSNASDVFPERLLVGGGSGGRGFTFFCPDDAWQGFMDLLSKNGCGSFAGLLSTTPNTGEIFQRRLVGAGGLTVFCPEDKAVAAFDPTFRSLTTADRVAVLLYHGLAGCYGRKDFRRFKWVSVSTLEEDAASNKNHAMGVRNKGDALELWPSPPSYPNGAASVTKTVSELGGGPLALYVLDTVLLPSTVACLGYLGWLHCFLLLDVPLWAIPFSEVVGAVAAVIGFLIAKFLIPVD